MASGRHGGVGQGLRLVVAAIGLASVTSPVAGKDRAAQKVTAQSLDALARQYRDADLPLPPLDAPLVLALIAGTSSPTGDRDAKYVVGFRLGPEEAGEEGDPRARFLMGTQEGEANSYNRQIPATRSLRVAGGLPPKVRLVAGWKDPEEPYAVNNWLALAIQCHLRGYDLSAQQILARGLAREAPASPSPAPVDDASLRDALAATAWHYWMNILLTAKADRPVILARLEKLSADFPVLDGASQREYLDSLRQAMVPSRAAPGSVEAKIDALVDYDENAGPDFLDNNAAYDALLLCGFKAVPAFIAHLGDRRLTRAVTFRENAPPCPRLVGDVVGDLIEDLAAADEYFPVRSYHRPPGQFMDKDAAERWWAKARAIGEEAYMTRTIFPPDVVSVMFLSERYPQDLEAVYARQLAEKPQSDFRLIEQAISGCAWLGRDGKRRLFHLGAASTNLVRSLTAIARIAGIDRADAEALLIEKFDHWPTDAADRSQNQTAATLASVALQASDSAEVWQAYERALFRAAPAQRMQMLRYLDLFQSNSQRPDVRRLALLDRFLDDPDVPVVRPGDDAWDGPYDTDTATPGTRPLSVGNSTAGLLARLLGFKPPPGAEHNDRWWAKYRETARAAVDQHARNFLQMPAASP